MPGVWQWPDPTPFLTLTQSLKVLLVCDEGGKITWGVLVIRCYLTFKIFLILVQTKRSDSSNPLGTGSLKGEEGGGPEPFTWPQSTTGLPMGRTRERVPGREFKSSNCTLSSYSPQSFFLKLYDVSSDLNLSSLHPRSRSKWCLSDGLEPVQWIWKNRSGITRLDLQEIPRRVGIVLY